MLRLSSSGPTVIVRESILVMKSEKRRSKVIAVLMSKGLALVIRRERTFGELHRQLRMDHGLKFASHIMRAALSPIPLDERQISAVAGRIELDLRLGAAFTRFQTLALQILWGPDVSKLISYGMHLLPIN